MYLLFCQEELVTFTGFFAGLCSRRKQLSKTSITGRAGCCQLPCCCLSTAWVSFVVYRVLVTDGNFKQIALARVLWDTRASGQHKTATSLDEAIEAIRRQRNHYVFVAAGRGSCEPAWAICSFYVLLLRIKARISFARVFNALCWSVLIYRGIGGIATIITLLACGSEKFFPAAPEVWSPTSLAQLVVRISVSPNVYCAISKLDIFLNGGSQF